MSQTHREIIDTPNALMRTIDYLEQEWLAVQCFLCGKKRFVFLGCGSSYSLARSMSVMTGMHTGLPSVALAAGDLLLHAPRYARLLSGATVICISRSGYTSEMLMALDAVKSFGIFPAAIVYAENTPLASRCELTLCMPWAFDKSVCQTRSISNFYFTAAYVLAKKTDNQTLMADLSHIAENSRAFLSEAERLASEVAARPWTQCVALADAELEGIADEGALAFKEICQLPSNYYHLLDARHGPMVIFNENTLLIAAPGQKDPLELNFLEEMREKGAHVIAVSDTPIDIQGIINLPYGRDLTHIALGLPLIILCQTLAYYKVPYTGANPDRPAGLDAWISLDKKRGTETHA